MGEVVPVVLNVSLELEGVVRHREGDIHLLDVPVGGYGDIECVLARSCRRYVERLGALVVELLLVGLHRFPVVNGEVNPVSLVGITLVQGHAKRVSLRFLVKVDRAVKHERVVHDRELRLDGLRVVLGAYLKCQRVLAALHIGESISPGTDVLEALVHDTLIRPAVHVRQTQRSLAVKCEDDLVVILACSHDLGQGQAVLVIVIVIDYLR